MRDRNPLTYYLTGAALLLCCALMVSSQCACTYNQITFEQGAVRLADKVTVEPGQGSGDMSDTGSTGAPTTGGTGKMSPGGSNLLDGWLQQALVIQQGGETPSTTTPTVDVSVPASVVP